MNNITFKLPDSWQIVSIGDVCTHPQYGYTTKASKSGGIKLLRTTDITSGRINWRSVPFCTDDPNDLAKYILVDGDIVVSRAGSIGVSYLIEKPEKSVFASYLIRFKPFINSRYLRYFLDSQFYWREISENKVGIAVQNINAQKLKKIPVYLAPLNEQHRIVAKIEELFSEIDKGVESLKTAKAQLQVYRQALLKHAFEGKLTAQWRSDNPDKVVPAEELLRSIEQSREERYQQQLTDWQTAVEKWEFNGSKGKKPNKPKKIDEFSLIEKSELENLLIISSEWVYVRLAEIAMIGSGMSVSQERQLEDPIEVSYLRVANVQRGKLVLDEIKSMKIERFKLQELALKQWDILFNEGGDRDKLGRGWVWESQVSPCITQNHVFRATTYLGFEHHAKYISHWGNSFGQKYFDTEGKQTTNLASINKTVLSNFPIPLTSLEEQAQIISILESSFLVIDRFESDLEKGLAQAEMLRQSILKKAFSGQLVLQDPTDEPASELLKRIQGEKADRETATKTNKKTKK